MQQDIMLDKLEKQKATEKQNLFREREVDNLQALIYGDQSTIDTYDEDENYLVDTNRFDVNHAKLEIYLRPEVKRLLKTKFVTGQSQDQIMKNLLNMSDSDEEEEVDTKKKPKAKKEEDKEEAKENDDEDEDEDEDDEDE